MGLLTGHRARLIKNQKIIFARSSIYECSAKGGNSQANANHHANQTNHNNTNMTHNNSAYKATTNNHANQMNPNNSNYQGGKK